ncbi:PRTRC system ThiF family protein [Maribacter sp. ACAM166]|uniref:PRTRC system ThiF family protein n=1 Tax=Maribacter sp. ACAM166 TaxID=2508996 RepID=UPI0010FEB767|nr:PRTRC system ThiF family protein [Maribacter sp. ACAM166]TLP81846.1 PRTRC system ThiF family protein [Maribacter sp. ACAM166]
MKTDYHYAPNYFFAPTHPITIALIGAGGNGSLMLARLARLDHALVQLEHPGIYVTVFDGDVVQPSNVGRQLYAPQDVGGNKAICAVTKVNHTFGLQWDAVPERIEATDERLFCNLIISCVDGADFRLQLAKVLENSNSSHFPYKHQYYWMDLGNGKYFGQYILGNLSNDDGTTEVQAQYHKLDHIVDMFPNLLAMEDDVEQGRGCSYAEKLQEQSLFVNDVLTSMAVHCLYELLINKKIQYHGAFVNLETGKTNPIPIPIKPDVYAIA